MCATGMPQASCLSLLIVTRFSKRGSISPNAPIQKTATDDWFLNESKRRLKQLDAMDQIELLQKVVASFSERNGRSPADWAELARGGYVRGAIVDPNGEPYRLEGSTVTLQPQSRLLPLPWEGQKVQ